MKVLEIMGCRSSVARALVAKASGPQFDSLATTKFIFSCSHFAIIDFFNVIWARKELSSSDPS